MFEEEPIHALLVDDDRRQLELEETLLEKEGINSETFTNPEEGFEAFQDNWYDAIVSDYNMPGMDGLEFLQEVREIAPEKPFILFTGKGSEDIASEAISKGVTDYIQKGGTEKFELLANRVEKYVDRSRKDIKSALFEESAAHTAHSIMITDEKGDIIYANEAVTDASGYPEDEIIGENPRILQSGKHSKEFYDELWSTITQGEVWSGEIVNETKDGEEYTIDQTITPVNKRGRTFYVAINKS